MAGLHLPSGLVGSVCVAFGFMASAVVLVTCRLAGWGCWGTTNVRRALVLLLSSSWLLVVAAQLTLAVVAVASCPQALVLAFSPSLPTSSTQLGLSMPCLAF